MAAWLLALIPLLEEAAVGAEDIAALRALLAGGFAAGLSTITFSQWCAIVSNVVAAAPQVINAFSALHPAFQKLIADLRAGQSVQEGAASIWTLFTKNEPSTIPGYGPDGAPANIPNPDK